VHSEIHQVWGRGRYGPAIDFDPVAAWICLPAQLGDRTVHGDPASAYQLLARATGTHTGTGHTLLDPLFRHTLATTPDYSAGGPTLNTLGRAPTRLNAGQRKHGRYNRRALRQSNQELNALP
jgi:hypothetical protein